MDKPYYNVKAREMKDSSGAIESYEVTTQEGLIYQLRNCTSFDYAANPEEITQIVLGSCRLASDKSAIFNYTIGRLSFYKDKSITLIIQDNNSDPMNAPISYLKDI